ncbi:MAG: hypothetical protein U1E19_10090 [Rhodoblastus sp.]
MNPETGGECLPILGFSAIRAAGETIRPVRRSASAVLHVVEGEGQAEIDGVELNWARRTRWPCGCTRVEITNRSSSKPAYLFQVDDAPMQKKLGILRRVRLKSLTCQQRPTA